MYFSHVDQEGMNDLDELIVRVVELHGSPFDYGLKQSNEIKSTLLYKHIPLLRDLSNHSNAEKAIALLNDIAPNLVEELRGLAKGMDMNLETIVQIYSGYSMEFPEMGCTALIHDGYYVRNYDFSPELYDARLVFSKPIDGYTSVGFSQQVLGRLDGMNEKGLVVGLHFVNSDQKSDGFLATTIVRILLDQCANVEEAIDLISIIPHGYCYNYSMTDRSGRGIIVEASPDKQLVNFRNPQICTNHFQSKALENKNRKNIQSSLKRKEYIGSLLREELTPLTAFGHFNEGNSPLFFKHYKEYFGTLHTVVYSPNDLSLLVGVGEDCVPTELSLKKFLDGAIKLPQFLKGIIFQG